MPKYSDRLDKVFYLLSDPTRRRVLEKLVKGPAAAGDLAGLFPMALPSFMQHLKILEKAKLVKSRKTGRVRIFEIIPGQMREAENWLSEQRNLWEKRLDQLDDYLKQMKETEK
ncbi:MAG TPA: metalloregulator ArsR/SmtB family transcription factor [Leptospiraceae bacterium]|nr:metalloregulator ArsR/SmtB family transcription factor [Leptospiraceae bacterium]